MTKKRQPTPRKPAAKAATPKPAAAKAKPAESTTPVEPSPSESAAAEPPTEEVKAPEPAEPKAPEPQPEATAPETADTEPPLETQPSASGEPLTREPASPFVTTSEAEREPTLLEFLDKFGPEMGEIHHDDRTWREEWHSWLEEAYSEGGTERASPDGGSLHIAAVLLTYEAIYGDPAHQLGVGYLGGLTDIVAKHVREILEAVGAKFTEESRALAFFFDVVGASRIVMTGVARHEGLSLDFLVTHGVPMEEVSPGTVKRHIATFIPPTRGAATFNHREQPSRLPLGIPGHGKFSPTRLLVLGKDGYTFGQDPSCATARIFRRGEEWIGRAMYGQMVITETRHPELPGIAEKLAKAIDEAKGQEAQWWRDGVGWGQGVGSEDIEGMSREEQRKLSDDMMGAA